MRTFFKTYHPSIEYPLIATLMAVAMHPVTLQLKKHVCVSVFKIIFKFSGQIGVFIHKLKGVTQLWTKQNLSNII